MAKQSVLGGLGEFFWNDPLMATMIAAAIFAIATTPLTFLVLSRYQYLRTRRGRTFQQPSFASVICGMMLVSAIPAIFCALVIKSRSFDKNRYEFDPNKTWSVLDQGRGFKSTVEADEAVRQEMKRLADERKKLVNSVKKLDEAMLALRATARQVPALAPDLLAVLDRLGAVRQSVGLDAPQQLSDETAPPVGLAGAPASLALAAQGGAISVPMTTIPQSAIPQTVAPQAASATQSGLPPAKIAAQLAAVPEPQRKLAAMLPLSDGEIPAGWEIGKQGDKYIETFNAENLYEKIDGRAESFLQYDVRGMAYADYHPKGDDSYQVQVYIFEMSGPLKALGKYGTEKTPGVKPIALGQEGYVSAGSTLFYADKYYTQIVSTKDDAKFAEFALTIAKQIAAKQIPQAVAAGTEGAVKATPESMFALLPEGSGKTGQKYVAQDVFGYGFLSDVFMADYDDGGSKWQGFIRPYADAAEARKIFEKYGEDAKKDGADIKKLECPDADELMISSSIGLVDVVFLKGNVLGGVNGADDVKKAEAFARAFAKRVPAKVPAFEAPLDETKTGDE